MFPEGFGCEIGIIGAAGVQEFVVSFAGEMQIARKNQMQARVAVAIIVEGLEKREHYRAIRGGVQRGMKRPVPLAPRFHVGVVFERFLEMPENFFSGLKIFFGEIGDGLAEHVAFQDRACFEELHNFVGRESGDDSAAIGDDGDQSLGGQMAQGFADWDTADLKFGGDSVLAELFAFAQLAVQNFIAQALDYGSSQGLARNGIRFFGRGVFMSWRRDECRLRFCHN